MGSSFNPDARHAHAIDPPVAALLRSSVASRLPRSLPRPRPRYAAEEPVLNLYSARHYQTDEALYANFTKATGIKINRIEAGDEQLLERLKSEGAREPGRRAADRRRGAAVAGAAAGPVPAGEVGGARASASPRRCATRTATGSASRAARG